jgi:aminoglycoside 3-N-acetyltransferase
MHSSLRLVGEVEGGARGLLDILIDYFTEQGGLFCVPTHTWMNLGKEITLDMNDPHTCLGAFSDLAAADPRATRSEHPSHSMAVFGDPLRVQEFVKDEPLVDTCTPAGGCYGKIYDRDGYILLVGVGHNRNTYLHCVEEMLDVPNRLDASLREVTVKYKNGDVSHRYSRGHHAEGISDVSAQFPNYEPAFRYHGCIVDGFIGNAPTQLCNARKMKQVLELIYKRSGGEELLDKLREIPEKYYEGEL